MLSFLEKEQKTDTSDAQKWLLQYAFKLLARRRFTESQIVKKLREKKIGTEADINQVVERLKELEYIDDFTFAILYLEDALRKKPQGLKLLRNGLMKRGVPVWIIARAFQEKHINEIAVAEQALQKKIKTSSWQTMKNPTRSFMDSKASDAENKTALHYKQKLYCFLMSRGFSSNTISKVLPSL